MSERSDRTHFPALNRGRYRRKVINLPTPTRFVLDPVEERAREIIGELVDILHTLDGTR